MARVDELLYTFSIHDGCDQSISYLRQRSC